MEIVMHHLIIGNGPAGVIAAETIAGKETRALNLNNVPRCTYSSPQVASLGLTEAQAKEQGHDVVLWLWNEAVTLGRKGTADHVHGVNLTPLKDLLAAVQAANIPLWVCGACAVARQIGGADLVAGASIKGMPDYIKAVAERDRSVVF